MLLLIAFACAPAPELKPEPDPVTDTDVDTDATSTYIPPTGPTGDEETADTAPFVIPTTDVDCAALTPLPVATTTLAWVTGSEDFAFDGAGNELGVSGGALFRTPFGGPRALVIPGLSDSIRGMRVLADGTIAAADPEHQTIVGGDPDTGASWVIAAGVTNPNGIAIGVDGWIYAALTGSIVRVDPTNGTTETVVALPGKSFDGLTFSPDYQRLHFNEEIGRIWTVDVDPAGGWTEPVEGPDLPLGGFSILDGMTADACGNVYIVEMGGTVWRVTPAGVVEIAVTVPGLAVISAVNFGSGIGGFDRETLYIMDFIGKLYAADMGVPGKWEPYLP